MLNQFIFWQSGLFMIDLKLMQAAIFKGHKITAKMLYLLI